MINEELTSVGDKELDTKGLKIPIFDNSNTPIKAWLTTFHSAIGSRYGKAHATRLQDALQRHCSPTVQVDITNMTYKDGIRRKWTEFVEAIIRRYDKPLSELMLEQLTKQPKETLADFFHRIETALNSTSYANDEAYFRGIFLRVLQRTDPHVVKHILFEDQKSMVDILTTCHKFDRSHSIDTTKHNLSVSNISVESKAVPTPVERANESPMEERAHITAAISRLESNLGKVIHTTGDVKNKLAAISSRMNNRQSLPRPNRVVKRATPYPEESSCPICLKPGHSIQTCYRKARTGCYRCGSHSHRLNNCTNAPILFQQHQKNWPRAGPYPRV